jgi:hypothetical protein
MLDAHDESGSKNFEAKKGNATIQESLRRLGQLLGRSLTAGMAGRERKMTGWKESFLL